MPSSRIGTCLALAAAQFYCAAADFGGIKLSRITVPPVKDIGQALKTSGSEAMEELQKHRSEIADGAAKALGTAGAEVGAMTEQIPAKAEEVHEEMQSALGNASSAANTSLRDTPLGEMLRQGRKYLDSALNETKIEGGDGLAQLRGISKDIESMTPADALERLQNATASNETVSPHAPAGSTFRQSNSMQEESPEPEKVPGNSWPSASQWALPVLLVLALGGWLAFRNLAKPRRTGQPRLMDNELCEGTPVSVGFMGGGSGARQLAPPRAPAGSGFTRF